MWGELKSIEQYWLLHDNDHYHSINNIKAFLAVDYFCQPCLQGFTHKKAFDAHQCKECNEEVNTRQKNKIRVLK